MAKRFYLRYLGYFALLFAVGLVAFKSMEVDVRYWHNHNDFAHYYVSGKLLSQGENPYAYELEPFYAKYELKNFPRILRATNPPALMSLIAGISNLPPFYAFWLWSGLQFLSFVFAIVLLIGCLELNFSRTWTAGITLLFLCCYPSVFHFEQGQSQFLVLFLISLGIYVIKASSSCSRSQASRNLVIACLLWGIATSLKLFTWPLVFLAFTYGGLFGLLGFGLGFLLLTLPPIILIGPSIIFSFFGDALPYVQSSIFQFNGSNSLAGAIIHTISILGGDNSSSSDMHLSMLHLSLVSLFGLLALQFLDLSSDRKRKDVFVSVSWTLVLCCLFAPTGWSHYFVLLFVPLLVLLRFHKLGLSSYGLLEILIAFILVAFTQGRLRKGDIAWQYITSWWGTFTCVYLLFLLTLIRRSLPPTLLPRSNSTS